MQIAQLALQTLKRCYKQCNGDRKHATTDNFVRKTLTLIPRMANACASVLLPAIELMCQFSKSGHFHRLLSRPPSGDDSSKLGLELVLEESVHSLLHAAIALKAPLDSLLTRNYDSVPVDRMDELPARRTVTPAAKVSERVQIKYRW